MISDASITKDLENKGWQRRFIASGTRLQEAIEVYKTSGFDVHLEPFPVKKSIQMKAHPKNHENCRACYNGTEDHYIIFTKPL